MCRFSLRFVVALFVLVCFISSATAQSVFFDTTRMDKSVAACDNFYEYANGNWMKTVKMPGSASRWGTLQMLGARSNDELRGILDANLKTRSAPGSSAQLSGDFYAACMNEAAIERAGATPLEPYLKRIDQIKTAKDVQQQIARMHNDGNRAVFKFSADVDAKNSLMNMAVAEQGGLSLDDRDYYTNTDAQSVEKRAKFVEHMTKMFKLFGDDASRAEVNAKTVLAIQTRLAKASRTGIELRDQEKNYNKMTVAKLGEMTPNFDWLLYFRERNAPAFTEVNVMQPDFFAEVNRMMTEVSVADWKTYFRWMTIQRAAPMLSKKYADEDFDFFLRYLNGVSEPAPRREICVATTDAKLAEATSAEYLKRNFTPAAEKRVNELIDNLFAAYAERMSKLDWMSPQTREKALAKLAAYGRKIGYTKNPRGYAGLKIDRESFFENMRRYDAFSVARDLKDIGQKVDDTRWPISAATINAFYNPVGNEIIFSGAILQPPVFNPNADDAVNYGAVGAVIGHEITHGFDESGSQFDKDGNLSNWWTPEDRQKFEERADCLVKQFSGYQVQDGVFINGKLTEDENIADLGGLTIAWAAYQKSLEGKPRPPNIDGFTHEQRFFLGWSQVWATKSTPEDDRESVVTDTHSNALFRVNGTVSNLPQFAKAFGCKAGDKMVRAVPCKIW